jgi:hypothetical protein
MIGDKLIVWLSFNVHGNEFAGTESAMTVAYELVNPSNAETKKVVREYNCDPRPASRWIFQIRKLVTRNFREENASELSDREHMEEWPGGRYNHYIFDLNRDWAWQTQAESQRIALYNQWMPSSYRCT